MAGNSELQKKLCSVCANLIFLIYVSTVTFVLNKLKRHV